MMSELIHWLSERRSLTMFIVVGYFVPNVLCNDLVQRLSLAIERKLSLAVYNIAIGGVGIVTLVILSWRILTRLKTGPRKLLKATYWSLTALLVVMSCATLMAKNIEMVHFPQ